MAEPARATAARDRVMPRVPTKVALVEGTEAAEAAVGLSRSHRAARRGAWG